MKIFLMIILFLFIGALFIISNENLHLKKEKETKIFTGLYYNWLSDLIIKTKTITAQVISSDWLPKNNSLLRK